MINPTFCCAIEKGCIDHLGFSARMCIMCATALMRGRITRAVVDTAIHPGRRIAHAVIGERGTNMKRLCAHGSGPSVTLGDNHPPDRFLHAVGRGAERFQKVVVQGRYELSWGPAL